MQFLKSPGFLIRIAISVGYMALALFLGLHPAVINFLSTEMTYTFSAVILIYGLFRAYRAYQTYKEGEE